MMGTTSAVSVVSGTERSETSVTSAFKGTGSSGAIQSPFADLITDAVGQVNQLETEAKTAVSGLMTGTGVDVHTAMIASEKATMALEFTLALHNKAVQAYQSVMGMQF